MTMDIRNKIMIGIGIALTLGAIIGVIVGVTTHTEAGLMSVCWQLDGAANYEGEGCVSPEEIMWDNSHMPLSVNTPGDPGEVSEAVDLVNSQVGCTVLSLGTNTDPDVLVLLNEPVLVGVDDAGGATSHHRVNGRMTSIIRTFMVGDPYMHLRVLTHEFGHALGLAHDDFESSVMFPSQPTSSNMDFVMFSDNDRNLLNTLYCHD